MWCIQTYFVFCIVFSDIKYIFTVSCSQKNFKNDWPENPWQLCTLVDVSVNYSNVGSSTVHNHQLLKTALISITQEKRNELLVMHVVKYRVTLKKLRDSCIILDEKPQK